MPKCSRSPASSTTPTRRSSSSPDGTDHEVRAKFFTPRVEAGFVGHATVAAHYVLSRRRTHVERLRQKSKAGIVDIDVRGTGDDRRIAIRQPRPPVGRELNDRERLAVLDALALATDDLDLRCPIRIAGSGSTRLMVGVRAPDQLKALKPDSSRLTTLSAQLGAAGYFIFTLAPTDTSCFTESRMFCPALGIPEDPVSGNAHGLLGAYLAECGLLKHDGRRAAFSGAQGHHLHRPGRVDVELELQDGQIDARVDHRPGGLDLRNRNHSIAFAAAAFGRGASSSTTTPAIAPSVEPTSTPSFASSNRCGACVS